MTAIQTRTDISVDYSRTIQQMVLAGNYDAQSDDITSPRFRIVGNGVKTLEVEIISVDRGVHEDELTERIDATGFRHAAIEELLAFGEQYPNVQRAMSIICLGSIRKLYGLFCVPCLSGSNSLRELRLAIPWLGDRSRFCRGHHVLVTRHTVAYRMSAPARLVDQCSHNSD